jgi:hypothetical protein
MAQGGGKKNASGKNRTIRGKTPKVEHSKGSDRKKFGKTSKNMRTVRNDYLRDKTGKSFIGAIENEMASRVPSDQRARLSVLKSTGPAIKNRVAGKKKPLTRGRSRKGGKSKGTK